jgi:hypothetical protein
MTLIEPVAGPGATLSDAERLRLAELERVIASGLDVYVQTGRALEEIRTRRLYLLTHETFREYLAERWGLSHPRGFALCYSAQVADVLEAAGEHPEGAESALRELAPVLHRDGPEAAVAAFRQVAPDGVLQSAAATRKQLLSAGLVDAPARDVADGLQRRIRWLEQAVPRVTPHETLRPLLAGYAVRLRRVADHVDALADPGPPVVPAGALCIGHGSRRGPDGKCVMCKRVDISPRRD